MLSIGVIAIDQVSREPDEAGDMETVDWVLANRISVGAATPGDFKGVEYAKPPSLSLCPDNKGFWNLTFSWKYQWANHSVAEGAPVPKSPAGRIVLTLPAGSQYVGGGDLSMMDTQTGSSMRKLGSISPPTIEVKDHNVVAIMDSEDTAGLLDYLVATSMMSEKFRIPSATVRKLGLGKSSFVVPIINPSIPRKGQYVIDDDKSRFEPQDDDPPAGLGLAVYQPIIGGSDLRGLESVSKPGALLQLCNENSPTKFDFLNPPPERVGASYEWLIPADIVEYRITGQMAGGWMRVLSNGAIPTLLFISAAAVGAWYGVALQDSQKPTPANFGSRRGRGRKGSRKKR